MEILIKGKKPSTAIFGCRDCECVFTADADEFYYDANNEENWCVCPECGAKCTGAELSCYFCEYRKRCDHKSAYDEEICHSFEVHKFNLWERLGYPDKEVYKW